MIEFTLSFEGNDASSQQIDFYDVARAMEGFQRSLAITTHLVINGEVITQAPSLKNARILAIPPEEGSWKITATIIGGLLVGGYKLGTAPTDTPLGNLVHSAYDYIISESLGFHVDYEKSLGQQYDELNESADHQLPKLKQSQFDSAIEKCETAVTNMHRPIVKSQTAETARIIYRSRGEKIPIENILTEDTYEYIRFTRRDDDPLKIVGRISSYNINTYKGRIFVIAEQRPIPFELSDIARTPISIRKITESLSANASQRFENEADIECIAYPSYSRSGILKSYFITEVL